MQIRDKLRSLGFWGSATIALVALAIFELFLGGNWFTASTGTNIASVGLASDDYVTGYFLGPGQPSNDIPRNSRLEPERVTASAPGIGW